MKMLSMQRPRPSMLIRTPPSVSVVIQADPANWLPWSRVHDLGRAEAVNRLVQRLDAEIRVHCVRQPPGQRLARRPVWNSPGSADTFWLSWEGVHMPRTRDPHPADFRDQIIALARAARSVESPAREFEPCAATIAGWIRQAGIDGGARDHGPTRPERD
jgi:hypothetical protein